MVTFPSVEGLATVDPSSKITLTERSVHVWSFTLQGRETVVEQFHRWLSDEEQARSVRFIHPDHQIRYTLAHGALRAVLATRYLGLEPAALRFCAGPTGKPVLLDEQGGPHVLRFNLSHSHGRMLLTVANGLDVGIDLEQIRETVEVVKLAERFYAPAEYQQVIKRSGSDQARQFYRYWVAKEALLKGQGVGLRSLQQCEIFSADAFSSATVRLSGDSGMQSGWTIRWLDCGTGWLGAVAAHGTDWSVRIIDGLRV